MVVLRNIGKVRAIRYYPTKQKTNEWLRSTLSQDPRIISETARIRLFLTPHFAIKNEEGSEVKIMTIIYTAVITQRQAIFVSL